MSRTNHRERAEKRGIGKEYWKSRLHPGGEVPGRDTKRRTHRKERQQCRAQEKVHNDYQ